MRSLLSLPEFGIFATLAVLIIGFQIADPVFLTAGNIAGMLRALSYTGLIAIGLAICLISGTIDISVGAIAGLASVVFAKLLVNGIPFMVAAILGVFVGALAGYINALVIVRLKVAPFIVTISTLYAFRGIATFISSGFSIYPLPPDVTGFGSAQPLGLSYPFLIFVYCLITVTIMLRSNWGLELRATGSDYEAAYCNEVDVKAVQTEALVLCGSFAGLAGVLVTTILGAGQPTAGTGWELIAIAGCAIGGVSLFGYEGSMIGLFAGLLTLQVISNGIITVGIPPYFQNVVIGAILLGSMIIDVRRRQYMNIEQF